VIADVAVRAHMGSPRRRPVPRYGGTEGGVLLVVVAALHDLHRVVDDAVQPWGECAAEAARWELLLGRLVPEPTEAGQHGKVLDRW
jgi:hypothetical protein